MGNFGEFTHKYQVSKTLRFELIPQGKTLENVAKYGIVDDDKRRSENYKKLKPVIDRIYKYFIDESLKNVSIDWQPLYEAIIAYRKEQTTANVVRLKEEQEACRKAIAAWFEGKVPDKGSKDLKEFNKTQSKLFKELFGKELFTESVTQLLPGLSLTEEEKELLASFNKFTSYFKGFYVNRKNVFSADDISTSIPHRLVQENFPKFMDNCEAYRRIVEEYPELKAKLEGTAQATGIFIGFKLDNIFKVSFYNHLLQQSQIDLYNQFLCGIAGEEGTMRVQGLNVTLNLAMKQDKVLGQKLKSMPHRFIPLYKQILSDRTTLSFIPEAFQNDEEVLLTVEEYRKSLEAERTTGAVSDIFNSLQAADLRHVYVNPAKLTAFSQMLFEDWSLCRESLRNWKLRSYGKAATKKVREEIESWLKESAISLDELQAALADGTLSVIINQKVQSVITTLEQELAKPLPKKLKTAEEKESLKSLLDSVQEACHSLEMFAVGENMDTDPCFYVPLREAMEAIQPIIPLYNKVRNFATQKPYSIEKFKLNFSNPILASGWDENRERQTCAILFRKGEKYYLGIYNAKVKPDFSIIKAVKGGNCFEKVVYRQFPDFSKMMPKCTTQLKEVQQHFASSSEDYVLYNKKFIKPLTITKEIYDLNNVLFDGKKKFQIDYLRKTKDEDGYYHALHTWINFAKEFVASYESTSIYDTSTVLSTEQYVKLNDFYGDLDNLFYRIKFESVSEETISEFVDEGKLFLFQIYNKDFAEGATGAPNLHTIYWKAVFDPENMKNVVVKLNGQAELFYRPKSAMDIVRHKVGEKLVNRRLKDGTSLTEELHEELYLYANGKLKKKLSEAAAAVLPQAVIYDVHHEIVKDRRFTEDKFFFHVPLTLNYKCDKNAVQFNASVQEYLKENPDTYIIGIDRGERNLIYAVVIDPQGNIIEQKSFNVINGFDYHNKLEQREKERNKARQDWTTVGKIKELKQGYLSLVVHEITSMMVKYNAIVVLENLNVGFKRIRSGIAEKAVYQQFEKMLINKLNYLMFKDVEGAKPGSVLNAYQLTDRFESFASMRNQTGFLFYIPAAFTSKIDPATGFVDPFCWSAIKTLDDKKTFISGFDTLKYDNVTGNFILHFEMKKNKDFQKKLEGFMPEWDIVVEANKDRRDAEGKTFISGKRIEFVRENNGHGHYEDYLPCKKLVEILQQYGILFEDGKDVLPLIMKNGDSKLIHEVFKVIRLSLQMRNSNAESGEDFISSPVENNEGICFDSRLGVETLPKDADANGAYHIALKGLLLLEKIRHDERKLGISNSEWLNHIQSLRG